MTNVLVLGASGMVGSMVTDVLEGEQGLKVTATVRSVEMAQWGRERLPSVRWEVFDAVSADPCAVICGHSWVINAIGITKPYIRDDNPPEVQRAIMINALLPHRIAEAALNAGARVLHIATDCTYSGARGQYTETDPHDSLDVYGKTKSLGEVGAARFHNLRCSMVGPEPKRRTFLLEWFRGQPPGAGVVGYTNQRWNGVTTLQFARVCAGIIVKGLELSNLQHLVPAGSVTKAELLEAFAEAFKREDIAIDRRPAPTTLDRTLATVKPGTNQNLWSVAGYPEPPTVRDMVIEAARYGFRLGAPA